MQINFAVVAASVEKLELWTPPRGSRLRSSENIFDTTEFSLPSFLFPMYPAEILSPLITKTMLPCESHERMT